MSRGKRESRATKVAGGFSLLVGVASAVALTGAAFFTVQLSGCGEPGSYIRHDNHVELVGGCVDPAEVPGVEHAPERAPGAEDESGRYRP